MIGVIASLAVTVGLLLLALRLLKRLTHARYGSRDGVELEVLQRISIAPRQGVALVRVGGRVLVMAVGEKDTSLLTELEGVDLDRIITPEEQIVGGLPNRKGPGKIKKLAALGMLAIALLSSAHPNVLHAQSTGQTSVVQAVPQFDVSVGGEESGLKLSGPVGLVLFLGVMTVIPALLLMMTSFTRILIVLHMVRSAMGTQSSPPGQMLVAMALVMTAVVMAPTLKDANDNALQPYLHDQISQEDAFARGLQPFRRFMLANTSENELNLFIELGGSGDAATLEDLPTMTLMSSFVTSELRTAFQMGFVIFLPFIVIDLVVASVLMSMGMFMLPPVMVSLPFKLLLFVLADGWVLLVRSVIASFHI